MTDPDFYPINPDEELTPDTSPGSLFVNRKDRFLQVGADEGLPEVGQVKANGPATPLMPSQSYVTDVDAAGNLITYGITSGGTYTCSETFTGLLDLFGSSSVALSLRRLTRDYTGPLIRVRRDSDDDELEIGFNSSNLLDTDTLSAFVGAGDGFVSRWYNQAVPGDYYGEGIIGGTAYPPRIVSSGNIVSDGATYPYPAIEFPGSRFFEGTTLFSTSNRLSTYSVFSIDTLLGSQNPVYDNGNSFTYGGSYHLQCSSLGQLAAWTQDINDLVIGPSELGGTQMQVIHTADYYNLQTLYKQGAVLDTNNTAPAARNAAAVSRIGFDYQGSFMVGKIQEIIAYPASYSANFYQIYELQNNFYQIY